MAKFVLSPLSEVVRREQLRPVPKAASTAVASSGQTEAKKVTRTFERQVEATLVLHFANGERIETTPEHPFYVEHKGFTPAGELGIGTSIVTRAGPSVKLERVEAKTAQTAVYNFEVEDTHTYFVGSSNGGLWVHNDCVYQSFNGAGTTQYVGITNNFATRASQHAGRFNIRMLIDNLSRADARAVEQTLIEHHGLSRNGGTLLNRINSIAASNSIHDTAVERGAEILQSIGYPGF